MFNTKQIVADAVAAGATKYENAVISNVSFSPADNVNGVDFWVAFTIDKAVSRMQEVDGEWKEQKSNVVLLSNVSFRAILQQAIMSDMQLMPLMPFMKIIMDDCLEVATANKSGRNITTPLVDLFIGANASFLGRKVEKDTEVKSLFSLNEKTSKVKNDSFWYDAYNLNITRAREVSYEFDKDYNVIEVPVIVRVLKHYHKMNDANRTIISNAKANNGFASSIAQAAAAQMAATSNLPE